jgi:hypothetical protein
MAVIPCTPAGVPKSERLIKLHSRAIGFTHLEKDFTDPRASEFCHRVIQKSTSITAAALSSIDGQIQDFSLFRDGTSHKQSHDRTVPFDHPSELAVSAELFPACSGPLCCFRGALEDGVDSCKIGRSKLPDEDASGLVLGAHVGFTSLFQKISASERRM